MKLVVHKMHGCQLCKKCEKLLRHWGIPFRPVYDEPKQDRLYPYVTIELEYEETVNWIAMEKLK